MNVKSINDLNLHDSDLLQVIVKHDEAVMIIDYIDDYETGRQTRRELVFRGCTEIHFKINPGYASPESILGGKESPEGSRRRIEIETNTTASILEIVASSVELRWPS